MQNFTQRNFKWLSGRVPCPDDDLLSKNYKFYTECELDNINYEVGLGAVVKIESVPQIGVIHYFYEIPHSAQKVKKIVAFELFYKPKEIESSLAKPIDLDPDLEVVKKDKVTLIHIPVYLIKSRCIIVYGLHDEEPQDLFQEFIGTTTDTIYVCRYIAKLKNGLYDLKSAIAEEDSIIEIEDDSPTAGNFSVTRVENIASNIKIKLKRDQNFESPQKSKRKPLILAKKTQQSPSELMRNLTLSPKKLPSSEQVQIMNKNLKQMNKRKSVLPSLKDFSDEDREPIVLLDKLNLTMEKSSKIVTRRSSRVKTVEHTDISTPTRSSKRQTSKISYEQFNIIDLESPEKQTRSKAKKNKIDSTPTVENIEEGTKKRGRPKKNQISDDLFEAVTPKRSLKKSPVSQRKNNVTFHETPIVEKTPNKFTPKKTPRSGRLNIMTMTPTIEERENPIVFCNTPMSRARMGLSAYTVPTNVPCRENEYSNIYNFVTGRLMDESSGCMYISGVPGTGKTMTVCRVMDDLSKEMQDNTDFVFLKLNALALTEPRQIYVEIVKKLLNKKLHWEEALKEMERFFKAKKRKAPHVILIDELDKLCNRKQDVVYNLLDLPFNSVTPLIVITIANTMDLPERILTNKVNSRLGLVRLTFKPYQYKDLVKIVTERLASESVFKTEALELVARKVAAVSGDARRALAMCSRATEIAEEEDKDLVSMAIVDKVLNEMSSSSKVQAIQCCSKLEQLVLTAIANEVTRTGNEEVPFVNMLHNLEQMCLLESFKLPSPEISLRACHNLGSFRLLITQHGRTDINMTIMLNISTDDVHYALRK